MTPTHLAKRFSLASIIALSTLLTACGGSSGGGSGTSTSDVSIGFSDAPVDDAEAVVIKVDKITFQREGEDDIVVDTFTSTDLDIEDADTFTIDLLEVQGNDNKLVLDSVILPVGEYKNIRIEILDENIEHSYVDEIGGSGGLKPIKVPSDELKLGAFTVSADSSQTFVIEFGLRQAMTYNPGPDRYILKPRGVRIVRLADASSIGGTVDLDEIHLNAPCSTKPDSTVNNVAYLYEGHGLDASLLGDVFVREDDDTPLEDQEFDDSVGDDIIAPVVATTIAEDENDPSVYKYLFSYLQPGDYTIALSCVAENDSPVYWDDIEIPAPSTELIEVTLAEETQLDCPFPNPDSVCTPL